MYALLGYLARVKGSSACFGSITANQHQLAMIIAMCNTSHSSKRSLGHSLMGVSMS